MESGAPPAKWHSFKMILDPQIHAGVRKTVRYDGCLSVPPGGPGGAVSINPSDPRSKMPPALARWRRLECLELNVPRFKIDCNYVGDPPPVEVTLENLNDNVDKTFLERMIRKFGNIEELEIYYHPVRRKHLGLARIVFELVRSAKQCVKELHGKSVMGKQLNCYVDPFFASARKMYSDLTSEKKEETATSVNTTNENSPSQRNNTPFVVHDPRDMALERRNSFEGKDDRGPYYDYAAAPQQGTTHLHNSYPPPSSGGTPQVAASGGSSGIENHPAYSAISMEYWQQTPQPPQSYSGCDASNQEPNQEAAVPPGDEESTDSQKMDLDTRLKLLMKKGSGSGLMPAFLLNELNSEEEGGGGDTPSKDLNNGSSPPSQHPLAVLSRPPSPFISPEAFEACSIAWQESLLSKAENRIAANTASNNNNGGRRPTSRNSDQMSLSSLSSGDDKILQQTSVSGSSGVYPPLGGGAGGGGLSFPPPPGSGPFNFPPYSGGWGFDPYSQQWTMHGGVLPPLPGYPPTRAPPPPLPYGEGLGGSGDKDEHKRGSGVKVNLRDQYRKILDESVDVFVRDLKRTVRRDMTKKIGETFAFNLYDEWWQTKENEYKCNQLSKQKHTSTKPLAESNKIIVNNASSAEDQQSRIPKAEDLTSIFDKQRDLSGVANTGGGSFGAGGSLGFGFRGSIPKLPSFKIKPAEKKRSDSSEDDSSSRKHRRDPDYQQRRKRREERHRRRREDDIDVPRRSSKERHHRDKSSSSSHRRRRRRSSSNNSSSSKRRTEKRREREKRRDKRLQSSKEEDEEKEKPKENKTATDKLFSKKEETEAGSKVKSQTIYTSSSSEDEQEHKNDAIIKADKKSKAKTKSVLVSSSSDEGEVLSPEETEEDKSVPMQHSSSSEEKENKMAATVEPKKKKSPLKVPPAPLRESLSSSSTSSSEEEEDESSLSLSQPKKPSKTALATQRSPAASSSSSTDSAAEDDKRSPPHIIDHCYAAARPKEDSSSQKTRQNSFAEDFANDHGYTKPLQRSPSPTPAPPKEEEVIKKKKKPKKKPIPLLPPSKQQAPATSSTSKWPLRDPKEQFEVVYRFLTHGLDLEDLRYLKSCYEMMLNQHSNNKNMMWMNDSHWVDHPVTDLGGPLPGKRRKKDDFSRHHTSGSCRTEGYYKMDPREKMRTKYHLHRDPNSFVINKITNLEGAATRGKIVSAQNLSREARNNQRRQLAVLGDDALNSDLLKFNQLKFRRKQMTFGKSAIHDWGLFAMEDIGADEMVIEYVGSVIRPVLSDVRENRYEKQGIGSSYLFRIDSEYVVDATKCGNLARFINHSCDPNCYAKIITIDGEKKIVIYSKQPIAFGEEITYDYKFPIEDEKIRCLCGSKNCRKYLN